jgi:hypothetical protein
MIHPSVQAGQVGEEHGGGLHGQEGGGHQLLDQEVEDIIAANWAHDILVPGGGGMDTVHWTVRTRWNLDTVHIL